MIIDDARSWWSEPERQSARERVPLEHWRGPLVHGPVDIVTATHQLPDPQQAETGRQQQQPEVERLVELQRGNHDETGLRPEPPRLLRGDPHGPAPRPRGAHVRALAVTGGS